ncbi:hypothetical protein [Ornithinibacillus xuwenensis]|uniref:Uncharacterized protein n=1 Tax=Ornithinibacillus xuwenensis TaxID=3144668 RepID=A0ABU9XGN1_9BACI
MRKRKKILIICFTLVFIFAGLYATTYIPKNIITIKSSEVTKIEIFDGNRGESVTITDDTQKQHIISNLNEIKFQKGKPSIGYLGYRFRLEIYNENSEVYKEIIINSKNKIRYKGFFYTDEFQRIDIDYLDNLFERTND